MSSLLGAAHKKTKQKSFFILAEPVVLHWSVSTGNQHAEKTPACHEKPRCVSSCFGNSMQVTLVSEKKNLYFPLPLAGVLFTSSATKITLHEK